MNSKNHQTVPHMPPVIVADWLKENTTKLRTSAIDTARLDCLLILEAVLGKPREWIMAHEDHPLHSNELKTLNTYVSQRTKRIPLAYILGSKEFYGRQFFVNKHVLIPRPESETIIEASNQLLQESDINTVMDIGTGSGVLGITAKLEHTSLHVIASDISKQALIVARKNAKHHNAHLRFVQSDMFSSVPNMPKTRLYVILANLPYVPDDLVTSPEISSEPKRALFSGSDGLKHYRKFWGQVAALKNKPTYVITESLESQHDELITIAKEAGYTLHFSKELIQVFTQ